MADQQNREDVSLSFHCIKRTKKKKEGGDEKKVAHPFTLNEFKALHKGLQSQKKKDINDADFQSNSIMR